MQVKRILTISLFFILPLTLALNSCHDLDEDGGYYNKKTGQYKYVKPKKRGINQAAQKVNQLRPGELQQIKGKVTKIEPDGKTIWLRFNDRQSYMIIASRLAMGNRDDEKKLLRIALRYVAPMSTGKLRGKNRDQWRKTVLDRLEKELFGEQITAEITFEGKAKKIWGTIYRKIETKKGEKIRNINLWMIYEGLSYYIIDRGKSVDDEDFVKAQRLAKKRRAGVWNF